MDRIVHRTEKNELLHATRMNLIEINVEQKKPETFLKEYALPDSVVTKFKYMQNKYLVTEVRIW